MLDRLGYGARIADLGSSRSATASITGASRSHGCESAPNAYDLNLGTADVMVAYLLEIT